MWIFESLRLDDPHSARSRELLQPSDVKRFVFRAKIAPTT